MDVFAGLLVVLLAGVAEPPGSRLTLDRVADAVLARQGRLRRLFVEGYMTTTVGAGTQTDRFATAFVRGRCFLDFMHGTGANDPPWQDSARFELWLTSDRATLFKPFTPRPVSGRAEEFVRLLGITVWTRNRLAPRREDLRGSRRASEVFGSRFRAGSTI